LQGRKKIQTYVRTGIKKLVHLKTDKTPGAFVRDPSQISEGHNKVNMGTFSGYVQNLPGKAEV